MCLSTDSWNAYIYWYGKDMVPLRRTAVGTRLFSTVHQIGIPTWYLGNLVHHSPRSTSYFSAAPARSHPLAPARTRSHPCPCLVQRERAVSSTTTVWVSKLSADRTVSLLQPNTELLRMDRNRKITSSQVRSLYFSSKKCVARFTLGGHKSELIEHR